MFHVLGAGYYISKNHFTGEKSPDRVTQAFEIELFTTGGGKSRLGTEVYERAAGSLLVAKPGQARCSYQAFEAYYVHFTCDEPAFAKTCLEPLVGFRPFSDMVGLTERFLGIAEAHTLRGAGYELIEAGELLRLIGELHRTAKVYTVERYAAYCGNIGRAVALMKREFGEKLPLADMAREANMSPSFFHRVFLEQTGVTPHEYLTRIRLDHARKLLLGSGMSIAEISFACGFSNQSYLNYLFQKRFRTTPGAYRQAGMAAGYHGG